MSTSDNSWSQVVSRKSKPHGNTVGIQPAKIEKPVIHIKGSVTGITKKGVGNKVNHSSVSVFRKLDSNDDINEMKKVVATTSKTLGQKISQARNSKQLTRVQLASTINEREQVVAGFENGTALFSMAILQKINRVLGTSFKKTD